MRRLLLSVLALLVSAALALPTLAQFDNFESVGRYQEEIKRQKLGPALEVDQGTVDRLLEIDQRYRPLKEQAKKEAVSSFRQLQELLRQPSPPEDQVQVILDRMIAGRKKTLNIQQRQLDEEMAVLTPVQQARYLMFLMSLRRQMAREAMNLRSAPPDGARPMAPPRELPVVRPGR